MRRRSVLLPGAAIASLIPPVVFCLAGVLDGMPVGEVLDACIAQYRAPRQNLAVVGLVGLFPLGLLTVLLWIAGRLGWARLADAAAAAAGLAPVLLVLVWVNTEFWPLFLPSRIYPGFPHGLEFVLGPGFYAPIAMLLGLSFRALFFSKR